MALVPVSGLSGADFISSSTSDYIRDVTIKDITVYGVQKATEIQSFSLPLGTGYFDRITLENITYIMQDACPAIFILAATCNNLIFRNIQVLQNVANNAASAAAIQVDSTSSIASLRVDNFDFEDSNNNCATSVIGLAGTVNHAIFSGTLINRTSVLAYPAIQCSGTTGTLQLDNGHYDHIQNVVAVTAGTTTTVQATGVSHTNSGGGASFARTGGTFWRWTMRRSVRP